MENTNVPGLRSRSRSKTPFLRSNCDHENCLEDEEPSQQKSGRKTPIKRSTPTKQPQQKSKRRSIDRLIEEADVTTHDTRNFNKMTNRVKTSDYSSEESPDRLKEHSKEIYQNEINSQYESVSTSTHRYGSLADVTFSPIHTSHHVTSDRSKRFGSPTFSACSTDSSFAEQALADASALLEKEPSYEQLPYRLYKMAGEYWNKYPKTDYTYSPLSRDRVELAPGQVAVPNMSRRSLSQLRLFGPSSVDETDKFTTTSWSTTTTRKRYTAIESSDDEATYAHSNFKQAEQGWWIVRVLTTIATSISERSRAVYRKVVGPSHRYPYTDRRPAQAGIMARSASAMGAPFLWMYTFLQTIITTTVTTITETISSSETIDNDKYKSRSSKDAAVKRKWWPLVLLLLLPAVGYGCYKYSVPNEAEYKPPVFNHNVDLNERVAALERWAINVDNRMKSFDGKLSIVDELDARIEQYSLKYLQRNLIQILNVNDNSEAIASKLKVHFDQNYVGKDEMQVLSRDIHEKLINSWKPDMKEEDVKRIVQEFLSTVEKRQIEVVVEKVKEYVSKLQSSPGEEVRHLDTEEIRRIVSGMLEVYDADKTGLVDYALESAGGQVISTRCTELYQIKTKQYSILGVPVLWVFTSPRYALTPGAMPAECWAFQGFPGYLVIRTYAIIEVTGFSLEHMSRLLAAEGKIESAPRNFSVYGLHNEQDPDPHLFGKYIYDANGTSIQYFPVQFPKTTNMGGVEYPVAYNIVELRVESNHGNPTYTCVYRFRVHGNPLNDIRRATEDSIRDSEV
ncbi:klaroid protein-like isoform X2 [Leptidea sinapis]|uniref:klaroid protein-like isoform X2 n=1 Tax=Leptidea sinapis TaxID=189913 RepID=UPI0021C2FC76|nr:klaroid protein-like isoform X2 [Leptidea sinapis]